MTACGQDPIEQRAAELASQNSSQPLTNTDGPRPGGGAGRLGVPEEPPPGVPNEPPPGQPLGGGGPQVSLSGEVALQGWSGAPIRVDIFDGDQRDLDGPRPSVIGVVRLEEPGAWSVLVSGSVSKLWVGAYADDNKDGKPDHNEPVGWYDGNPVVGGANLSALNLTLAVQPPE